MLALYLAARRGAGVLGCASRGLTSQRGEFFVRSRGGVDSRFGTSTGLRRLQREALEVGLLQMLRPLRIAASLLKELVLEGAARRGGT